MILNKNTGDDLALAFRKIMEENNKKFAAHKTAAMKEDMMDDLDDDALDDMLMDELDDEDMMDDLDDEAYDMIGYMQSKIASELE